MAGGASLVPAPVEPAPDLIEPLLGYRFWRVSPSGTLRCLVSRERWSPGVNRAECWRRSHEAPGRLCLCGFNAVHELPDAWERDECRNVVLGAIAAWGRVDVHRLGFRAELACVIALAEGGVKRPAPRGRLLRAAARHAVPLVGVESLPAEAARHARPIDPRILPGRHAAPQQV